MKAENSSQPSSQDERAYRIAYLIAGYVRETLTQEQHQELDNWVTESMDNQILFEELTDERNLEKMLAWKDSLPTAQILDRLKGKLDFKDERKHPLLKSWQLYAVAASVLGVILTSILLFHKTTNRHPTKPTEILVKDIAPGANRAILTLADGSSVVLDSTKMGTFVNQGNVQVLIKDSGRVQYQLKEAIPSPAAVTYNTLKTPRGGQYQVVLPDGTKAWLNAASWLKYPTSFTGKDRKVELSGEGYFEVADDPNHPFSVLAEGVTILVLGTNFNINTYPEKKTIQITLARGAVKVVPPASGAPQTAQLLRPGQQAQVDRTGGEVKIVPANLQTTLAWKEGLFIFQETPLEDVLAQVSRWYDVEISTQTAQADHFNASIPRNVPVSKLLHLLEQTGQVHFLIDPKKITVTN